MLKLPRLGVRNPSTAVSDRDGDPRDEGLSNGFLPRAPLLHDAPTAVGVWEIGSGAGIQRPPSPGRAAVSAEAARDQLLLVRLHGEPVSILTLEAPPGAETAATLARAVWAHAGAAIGDHARRHGCMPVPAEAGDLERALVPTAAACAGALPRRPDGQAAVILCTTGNGALLERCLGALSATRCQDFEVVVVDNRPSRPETRALVLEHARSGRMRVRYVSEPRPGLSFARNAGVAASPHAAYVAFVDDDVVVDEGWLSWLLEPFCERRVHAVTGLVLPLSLQSPVQKRFEAYAGFGKGIRRLTYELDDPHLRSRFLYPYFGGMFGSGNSMAFRRNALLAVGGFDLALGAGTPTGGGEDLAALTDIVLAAGAVVYQPRSICWHEHRLEQAELEAQVRGYGIGLTALFWRYLWRDRRFLIAVARCLPLTLRLALRRRHQRGEASVPSDLIRLEARARWLGPWRYVASRRRAARLAQRGGAGDETVISGGRERRGRDPATP